MSADPSALVVALTGGVAAGKSAVARRFEAFGVPVHDADVAAREVIAPGSDGLAEVVAAFGDDVLDDRGQLDRPAMRRRVFADPAARSALEAIIQYARDQRILPRAVTPEEMFPRNTLNLE